jgi:polysaccharide biosynthesis/export protein
MWGLPSITARTVAAASLVAVAFTLAGCGSALFPAAGPNSAVVRAGFSQTGQQYALVKLTPQVVNMLDEFGPRSLSAIFGDRRPPPEVKFGIGDVVSVTIFEAAAGGLFIPSEAGVRPGNFITLPNQPIDTAGNITVPYAGAVRAAGRTPSQVQQDIVDRIKDRAIEPQAVVALVTQNTSLITVIGEINTAFTSSTGRVPAQPSGEHLLDVITRAGGLKDQGQNSWVVLERNGRRASAPFGSLVFDPQNNIWAWPGDTIYIYQEPQTFLAFGASGQQGQFPFNQWRITLAEAIGQAGGLLDLQADPGSVFLYRREPRELAEQLGVDCSKFDGPTVPIVYSVDFIDPGGYFLATRVQMHNKDLVFAANAESVEVDKTLNFIQNVTATANGVIAAGNGVETWRINSGIK